MYIYIYIYTYIYIYIYTYTTNNNNHKHNDNDQEHSRDRISVPGLPEFGLSGLPAPPLEGAKHTIRVTVRGTLRECFGRKHTQKSQGQDQGVPSTAYGRSQTGVGCNQGVVLGS